jgi:DNA-directed RNA polymerase specialized sigma24 family protein
LTKAIELYVVNNYNELKKICVRITEGSYWADDLLNSVLLQLWERNDIKLENLDNDGAIKYYIVRCLTTNWYSKTSPFYRKIKRESSLYNEISDVADKPDESFELKDQKLMDVVEQEWGNLGWFRKDIFTRYMILGSYRRVSEQTNIPLTSIKNYVHQAKQEMKLNIFKKIKDE